MNMGTPTKKSRARRISTSQLKVMLEVFPSTAGGVYNRTRLDQSAVRYLDGLVEREETRYLGLRKAADVLMQADLNLVSFYHGQAPGGWPYRWSAHDLRKWGRSI